MKKAKDQPGSEPAELASLVGERIRKIREEEGLSLELFALRCDMNTAALQYFSQITRDLSPRTISSAAKHHKRDRSRDEMTLVIKTPSH